MTERTYSYFEYIIIIQLVFAFAITTVVYALPDDTIHYVSNFETEHNLDLEDVSNEIQGGVDQQFNLPLIDLGALVFYSGNIIIDLMLRFFFAIPEMVSIIIGTFFTFVGVDPFLAGQLQLLMWAVVAAFYMLGIIRFITNIRSRGAIV